MRRRVPVPKEIIIDSGNEELREKLNELNYTSRLVYIGLVDLMSENKETVKVNKSKLSRILNMSRYTVRKGLEKLEEVDFVEKINKNRYKLLRSRKEIVTDGNFMSIPKRVISSNKLTHGLKIFYILIYTCQRGHRVPTKISRGYLASQMGIKQLTGISHYTKKLEEIKIGDKELLNVIRNYKEQEGEVEQELNYYRVETFKTYKTDIEEIKKLSKEELVSKYSEIESIEKSRDMYYHKWMGEKREHKKEIEKLLEQA